MGGKLIENAVPHEIIYWRQVALPTLTPEDKNRHISIPGMHTVYNISQFTGLHRDIVQYKTHQQDLLTLGKHPMVAHHNDILPDRRNFESSESYYDALFKQMVSAHGYKKDRLDKEDLKALEAKEMNSTKLTAEIGSAYLLSRAGMKAPEQKVSPEYIKELEAELKKDKRFIIHASAEANKATDKILGIDKSKGDDSLEKEFPTPAPVQPQPNRQILREEEIKTIREKIKGKEKGLSR